MEIKPSWRDKECFISDEEGHLARECPKKNKDYRKPKGNEVQMLDFRLDMEVCSVEDAQSFEVNSVVVEPSSLGSFYPPKEYGSCWEYGVSSNFGDPCVKEVSSYAGKDRFSRAGGPGKCPMTGMSTGSTVDLGAGDHEKSGTCSKPGRCEQRSCSMTGKDRLCKEDKNSRVHGVHDLCRSKWI